MLYRSWIPCKVDSASCARSLPAPLATRPPRTTRRPGTWTGSRDRFKVECKAFNAMAVKRLLHAMERGPRRLRENWIGPVNFDRADMRVSAFDTYAVVATVMLQVVVGLYSSIPDPGSDATPVQRQAFRLQMLLLTVAVMCSTFTMVIFLLSKIYGVTALAMHKDLTYDMFIRVTSGGRSRAFWSLIGAMWSFLGAFVITLLQRIRGKLGYAAIVGTLTSAAYMTWEWYHVISWAGKHIYR